MFYIYRNNVTGRIYDAVSTPKGDRSVLLAFKDRDSAEAAGWPGSMSSFHEREAWASGLLYSAPAPMSAWPVAPLTKEWVSATKVCAFEPQDKEQQDPDAFNRRWEGYEVTSGTVDPYDDMRDIATHIGTFPMAGKYGFSTDVDEWGRTTFRNPLLHP